MTIASPAEQLPGFALRKENFTAGHDEDECQNISLHYWSVE